MEGQEQLTTDPGWSYGSLKMLKYLELGFNEIAGAKHHNRHPDLGPV